MNFDLEGFGLFCFSLSFLSTVLFVIAGILNLQVICTILACFGALSFLLSIILLVVETFILAFFD